MAAVDAQFHWMSAKIPNDQFLLYAFDGFAGVDRAIEQVRRRARACPDLLMRIDEKRWALGYPEWVTVDMKPGQVIRHELNDQTWQGCLAAGVGLADDQPDVRRTPGRVHGFGPALGRWRRGGRAGRPPCPGCPGQGRVCCRCGRPRRSAPPAGWSAIPMPG